MADSRRVAEVQYTVTYYAENGDVLYESTQKGSFTQPHTVQLFAKRLFDEAVSIVNLWGWRRAP